MLCPLVPFVMVSIQRTVLPGKNVAVKQDCVCVCPNEIICASIYIYIDREAHVRSLYTTEMGKS